MPQIKLEPIDDTIKPNDVVWSLNHGRCIVEAIHSEVVDNKLYTITVRTVSGNERVSFTKEGCYLKDWFPTLFKDLQGVPNAPCTVILEY